jgi:hypothetical protein
MTHMGGHDDRARAPDVDRASLENAPLGANIAQGIDIFWD